MIFIDITLWILIIIVFFLIIVEDDTFTTFVLCCWAGLNIAALVLSYMVIPALIINSILLFFNVLLCTKDKSGKIFNLTLLSFVLISLVII